MEKVTNKSIWIARDEAIIPDDMEHFIERHPEKRYEYAKLHIFYDTPEWVSDHWQNARDMCEIPNYMYPEIEEGVCVEFKEADNKKIDIRW